MDIGNPASLGMAFRVADIITVKRSLTANIALQFQLLRDPGQNIAISANT